MNIEFIKWMVGYAEGFRLGYFDGVAIIQDPNFDKWDDSKFISSRISYPLLLQRTIEGINRTNKYSVDTDSYSIMIFVWDELKTDFYWGVYESEDEAKEQALKYIYEQVASND